MIDDTKWLYNGLYIICIRLSIEHSRDLWTRTGYAFFMFFLPSSRSWLGCHFANQICTVFNDSEAPWYIYIRYSTHIYTLLCTSIYFIFNIVLSICYILLIFCLCGRFTASPNSELADWNSEKAKWCPWEECGDSSFSGLARPRSLVEPQPRSQTAWAVHFTSNKIGMKSDGSRMLIS